MDKYIQKKYTFNGVQEDEKNVSFSPKENMRRKVPRSAWKETRCGLKGMFGSDHVLIKIKKIVI